MKNKKLRLIKYTQEQADFVVDLVVKKGKPVTEAAKLMCEKFGIVYREGIGRSFRHNLQRLGVTENVKTIEDTPEFKKAQEKQFDTTKTRLIVGWCQNETPVLGNLMDNIEALAQEYDAAIHIIAGRYKNPTSVESNRALKSKEKNKPLNWDKRVLPYLDANRQKVHEFLTILSDIKTQPTASTPLSGFNGITGLESCVIGHPRVQMKSLPVLEGYPEKILLTTGAVSMENYTDTKAGKKGEFHHQYGFVVIELDGDVFHARQVTADKDGNFYDLFTKVENGIVSRVKSSKALVFGDIHVGDDDKEAIELSFDMADKLNPSKIILHDVFNGTSVNHHEQRDPFSVLQREVNGELSLKKEIKQLKNWFIDHVGYEYVVVRSNHDDFLDRWLMNDDWRKSRNKAEYLKYANILAQGKAPKGIIPYVLEKAFPYHVTCLGLDDGYRIGSWELSLHGHLGANGSKGTAMQFKMLNTKSITAHTHSPSREDGHVCVGTLTKKRVGYNKGMSSWMQSNVVIHENDKAQHINIIKGRYTTLK